MLINRKDLVQPFNLVFTDEESRDIWVAQALVWMNTTGKKNIKANLRKKASFQITLQQTFQGKPPFFKLHSDQDSSATVVPQHQQADDNFIRIPPRILSKKLPSKKASILSILSLTTSSPSTDSSNWIPDAEVWFDVKIDFDNIYRRASA
jgi:hypothetical protein